MSPRARDLFVAAAFFLMVVVLLALVGARAANAATVEFDGNRYQVEELAPAAALSVQVFSDDPVERWAPLVAKHFDPDDVDLALRIIDCESGGDPNAKNPTSSASGLFQHLRGWWAGEWSFDPFDPAQSVKYGARLFYDGGSSHWNASRSCWSGTAGEYSGAVVGGTIDAIAGPGGLVVEVTPVTIP